MFRLLAILYYLLPVLIQNVYSQRRLEIYVQGCQLQAIGMPVFSLIQWWIKWLTFFQPVILPRS